MLCGHAPCYAVRNHSGFWLRGSVHTPRSLSGAGASKQLQSRCSCLHNQVSPTNTSRRPQGGGWELSQHTACVPTTHTQRACASAPHSSKLRPEEGLRRGRVNQSQSAANPQALHSAQPKGGCSGRITRAPGSNGVSKQVGRCRREAEYLVGHGMDCRKRTRIATGAQALARPVSRNQAAPKPIKQNPTTASPFLHKLARVARPHALKTPHTGTHTHIRKHMLLTVSPARSSTPNSRCRRHTRQPGAVVWCQRQQHFQHVSKHTHKTSTPRTGERRKGSDSG